MHQTQFSEKIPYGGFSQIRSQIDTGRRIPANNPQRVFSLVEVFVRLVEGVVEALPLEAVMRELLLLEGEDCCSS